MRSFSVSLAIVLAVCGLVQVSNGKNIEERIDKINEYLKAQVNSENVDENRAAAEQYLKELKHQLHIFVSERVALLEKLLTIREARTKCDAESFDLLDDLAHQWNDRVYEVVKQVKNIEHPQHCIAELKAQVPLKIAPIDPRDLGLIKGYVDIVRKYMEHIRPEYTTYQLVDRGIVAPRNFDYTREVYEFAKKEQEVYDPQSVDHKSARQIVDRYIIAPCKIYVDNLWNMKPLWTKLIGLQVQIDEPLMTDIYRFEVCDYIRHDGLPDLHLDLDLII